MKAEDVDIENRFIGAVEDIIYRAKKEDISKILFVNLGDLLHFDTYKRTTSSGTPIAYSMNFYEMFDSSLSLFIHAIEALSEVAPVEFVPVFGNHDKISSYMFAKSLALYFRNHPSVEVDEGRLPRKYKLFGNNLVGFVHGDVPKKNISSLIQREAREEFGKSTYAEIHAGHFHSEQTLEKDGMKIRYLPTMASEDEWHYAKGYTGATKTTMCFLWDLEKGLRETWYNNV